MERRLDRREKVQRRMTFVAGPGSLPLLRAGRCIMQGRCGGSISAVSG
jgi:hypothetical protein